uniref:Coiled-coil domain-containing protein n=1 Tax=Ascaris lumbricoides TaxID=6252 RepID=A0A0M3IWB0_ASCLU
LQEKAKRCAIIGLSQESSNGTAVKEDFSVAAEAVQSDEDMGFVGPLLPDAISAAQGTWVGASARTSKPLKTECVLAKKRRKKIPKRRKNFCSVGLGWCSVSSR